MSSLPLTELIDRAQAGDRSAQEPLIALLHEHLHRRAAREIGRQGGSSVFQPTALVNEAWMKLLAGGVSYQDRSHFLGSASTVMRNLLTDHARRRRSQALDSREDSRVLDNLVQCYEESGPDLLELEEALAKLAGLDPEAAKIVELRFFVGASAEDAAQAVGLPERTATRRARRWLRKELRQEQDGD